MSDRLESNHNNDCEDINEFQDPLEKPGDLNLAYRHGSAQKVYKINKDETTSKNILI